MCALQMQAEAGPTLADNPDALEAGIEKYIVKQVPPPAPDCTPGRYSHVPHGGPTSTPENERLALLRLLAVDAYPAGALVCRC